MANPGRELVKAKMRAQRLLMRDIEAEIRLRLDVAIEAKADPLAAMRGVGEAVAAEATARLADLLGQSVATTLGRG